MNRSILISLLLMLIASISTFAQKPYITENFDINGIKIGSKVTPEILKRKLGEPTSERETVIPGLIAYCYGASCIGVYNGEVYEVTLRDNNLSVLTGLFEGGIRVGDNAEEVKAKILKQTKSIITETSMGFKAGNFDDKVNFRVSGGIITEIDYCCESI